ncbi:hypothetical protein RsTz2092_13080 [Deferribacterales bacterium RsTz2092]|nr:hypothetical protein AGMMS49941_12250 [Deferribacterales bacterium]
MAMANATAKVFMSGSSQAIRLPKKFRVDTNEVYISKEDGRLIISPKPAMSWREFFATFEPCPDFELERDNSLPQERELF